MGKNDFVRQLASVLATDENREPIGATCGSCGDFDPAPEYPEGWLGVRAGDAAPKLRFDPVECPAHFEWTLSELLQRGLSRQMTEGSREGIVRLIASALA